MPHRVTNFLRTSSSSQFPKKKKTPGSPASSHVQGDNSTSSSSRTSRNNSITPSPYTSDSDDHVVKMPEHLSDALKKHHRLSLPFGRSRDHHSSGSSGSHAPSSTAASAIALDWSIESPPIVFHGSPEESTGALVSGQMFMDVLEESVQVDSFVATLSLQVTQKRPFQSHCSGCQLKSTELQVWHLLVHPTVQRRGRHLFPFSTLLDGHLPASMDTSVLSIAYRFKAEAILARGGSSSRNSVCFERTLNVKRSVPELLYPHHSVRIFPPTNIKASAHYDSIVHPAGSKQVTLKLDGLMTHNEKVNTVDLWRLKKVTWKLEETIKTIAPPCTRHAPNAPVVGACTDGNTAYPTKGVERSETRILGEKQLLEGWKSDYTGSDGTIDFEFEYYINQCRPNSHDLQYACDTKTRDGTEVTHSLLVELIVSKEYAPEGKTHLATQTGTGRILRMHFGLAMTECPGLGVSWDNEAPPVYQDVPPSPPGYPRDELVHPLIEYEDLEALDARRGSIDPTDNRQTPTPASRNQPSGSS
ncbi:hypothetical protein HIM_05842 [Hirsutella minnesotensis 3608]|uniref:LDB19 N-terminal domain-containing protein n=1 Tax=Hirsutella minnesotensis 3608 TaxID=1043627 RepID=A0A0F7ZP18_9HYPO|nr:hypothetical protein HIM_05842 [Hirsutella minnesotensis 3608]